MTTEGMTPAVTIYVPGRPRPQGSLTAWRTAEGAKARIAHSGGIPFLRWRASITTHALLAMADYGAALTGPVALLVRFVLERPPGRPGRQVLPIGHPDIDKLLRAVLDGLAGVVYVDDAQVVEVTTSKTWASEIHPGGAYIEVVALPDLRTPYPEPKSAYPNA